VSSKQKLMDKQTTATVRTFGEALLKDLKAATPEASGATADSLRLEMKPTGFIIWGAAHIEQLMVGRGPTKAGAKKGNPTVQEQIFDWIKARSITPKESSMSQLQLSWAISKSIHKKGFKGKGDFYADVLTDRRFDSLMDQLLEEKTISLGSSLSKQFKKFNK
jgi:hypothetical protein